MKRALIAFGGLLVLIVLTVVIVPRLIDWNSYKPAIGKAVEKSIGRDLRIDGDLQLSVFPGLEFKADRITLSNVPGSSRPEMASIGSISGKVELLPLISRKLAIEFLIVKDPSLVLEVDASGNKNWQLRSATPMQGAAPPADSASPGGLAISDVQLGSVRIENGAFLFSDAASGQVIQVEDLDMSLAAPGADGPCVLQGHMVLNEEPVEIDFKLDSLRKLLGGERFDLRTAVASKPLSVSYEGAVQNGPVPGLDGKFLLDIPSVGNLARWLDRPLAASQPDPGPLTMRGKFSAESAKAVIEQLVLETPRLKAHAEGFIDRTGDVSKIVLNVESGMIDLDRYLPPPASLAPRQEEKVSGGLSGGGTGLSSLSDEPFDLSALQKTEMDVNIDVEGIKMRGIHVSRILATAAMQEGILTAELKELGVSGGKLKGALRGDATGKVLAMDVSANLDRVRMDDWIRMTGAGGRLTGGVISGSAQWAAKGDTPRALVEGAFGHTAFSLSDLKSRDDALSRISNVDVDLNLPGIADSPQLKAALVYNKKKVDLNLALDPLKKVFSEDKFELQASVSSDAVNGSYKGTIRQKPVAGLDGDFELSIPSVGRLLGWLDRPLPASQQDPGPLSVHGFLAADGGRLVLKQAGIEGKGIEAKADAEYDMAKDPAAFRASIVISKADLNMYLPEAPKKKAEGGKKPAPARQSGWDEKPFDLSALRQNRADVKIELGSVRYRDLEMKGGQIDLVLSGGVLKSTLGEIGISGGKIEGNAVLDASGEAPKIEYAFSVKDAEARPLLKAFAGNDRISGKADFELKGEAKCRSLKEMVSSMNGDGRTKFLDGAIHGINLAATLRRAKSFRLDSSDREMQKTDFAELSGTYVIRDGIIENGDLKMLAPLIRLTGEGQVSLPPQDLDYKLTARLVPTLQGQGGEDALAGLPIPISITGLWVAPKYAIDWESVFREAAKDPARWKSMPKDLRRMSGNMGIGLPEGAAPVTDRLKGLVGSGVGAAGRAPTGASKPPTTAKDQPKQSPSSSGGILPNPLKGLLGK